MKRTYIPKLLRIAEEMRLYLGKNQRNMSEAANLSSEQCEILSRLHKALSDLDLKIGVPLFPEYYQSKSRARPTLPYDQRPSFRELYARQEGRCYYCGCPLWNGPVTKAERQRKKRDETQPRAGRSTTRSHVVAKVKMSAPTTAWPVLSATATRAS